MPLEGLAQLTADARRPEQLDDARLLFEVRAGRVTERIAAPLVPLGEELAEYNMEAGFPPLEFATVSRSPSGKSPALECSLSLVDE